MLTIITVIYSIYFNVLIPIKIGLKQIQFKKEKINSFNAHTFIQV